MRTKGITAIVVGWSLLSLPIVAFTEEGQFSDYVDAEGNISLPEDFRKNMVHMGSWFVPDGEASGFHDVYTDASTIDAYRRTGEFPDGATLVKELRVANVGDYTTGLSVNYATGELKQWFVMIKDAKGRFPGRGAWGSGWGWALFKPGSASKNVVSNYRTDCLGCHIPAQLKDYIYVEAYPTLMR